MVILSKAVTPLITGANINLVDPLDERIDLGGALILSLLDVRKTLYTSKDKKAHLMVGGLVHPILKMLKGIAKKDIVIPDEQDPPLLIDIPYLSFTRFLRGKIGRQFAYVTPEQRKFMLPNTNATTLTNPRNIEFNPQEGFRDEEIPIWTSKASEEGEQSQPENEDEIQEEEEEEELFGTRRYHFSPYEMSVSSGGMKYAHEKIKLLQKWNKLQDRTIHKLVKAGKRFKGQIKTLKRQVKSLTNRLAGEESSRAREHQEEQMVVDGGARHSFAGIPSEAMNQEPRRHSSHKPRASRRRWRSPSPNESNDSYSINTEEDEGSPSF